MHSKTEFWLFRIFSFQGFLIYKAIPNLLLTLKAPVCHLKRAVVPFCTAVKWFSWPRDWRLLEAFSQLCCGPLIFIQWGKACPTASPSWRTKRETPFTSTEAPRGVWAAKHGLTPYLLLSEGRYWGTKRGMASTSTTFWTFSPLAAIL